MNSFRLYYILAGVNGGREVCHYCGRVLNRNWQDKKAFGTVDHVVPRALGGGNALGNLVLACARCNSSKGVQSYETFIRNMRKLRMDGRAAVCRLVCDGFPSGNIVPNDALEYAGVPEQEAESMLFWQRATHEYSR